MKHLSVRKVLYLLLALAALAGLYALATREPAQLVASAPVQRGELQASFVEEGKTRLKQRYVITAPVAGTLRRVTLQPGDAVRAGQVLAQIDPARSSLLDARARSQAQAEVRGADAAVAAARQRIAAAQASERLARTELARHQSLAAAGAVARETLDQSQARASTAAADLAAARADEQVAQQRLASARALLADDGRASAAGQPVAVTAPVAGVVLKRPLESATPLPAGQTLMEIGDATALEIESEVLSTDAVRLRPGLPARVLRWGGEGSLQAHVARVEPGGFTKVSALGVEEQRTRVILDFDTPRQQWAALGDAYRVEVQFITEQATGVLQVPASALFRTQDGWAVFKVVAGRAHRTPIKVGLRSASAAQVTEGLAEGELVIVQPDDRLHDGTRVRTDGAR